MSEQGVEYAAFIDDQLKAERDRQVSLNDRGAKLQQSTSVTLGLFATALGMVLGDLARLTALPLCLFIGTVLVVALSFLCGVLATRLMTYEVADVRTLGAMVNERWTDNPVDSRNTTAWLNALTIERLRPGNNWKAFWLQVGIVLQGLGVILGIATFGVVAAAALVPPKP